MGDRYLKAELQVIQDKYPDAPIEEIMAELPGRNWSAVARFARSLGLYRTKEAKGQAISAGRCKSSNKIYSAEEDQIIIHHFHDSSHRELTDLLPNRPWKSIATRANRDLHLKRSDTIAARERGLGRWRGPT